MTDKIRWWDWPDWLDDPENYNERVPTPTTDNLKFIAERFNELVDQVEKLESDLQRQEQ